MSACREENATMHDRQMVEQGGRERGSRKR
jgi:hypothetical protein